MKGAGKSVFDLDVRYRLEDEWQGKGLNIRSRKFFKALHDLQEAGKDVGKTEEELRAICKGCRERYPDGVAGGVRTMLTLNLSSTSRVKRT